MTRIVLFLTAVPLAAILALVLNALLERATERQRILKSLAFVLAAACLLALGGAAVDRQQLDELWNSHQPKKVKLLYQSRIPVTEQSLRENASSLLVDGQGRQRPRQGSPGGGSLDTRRR